MLLCLWSKVNKLRKPIIINLSLKWKTPEISILTICFMTSNGNFHSEYTLFFCVANSDKPTVDTKIMFA